MFVLQRFLIKFGHLKVQVSSPFLRWPLNRPPKADFSFHINVSSWLIRMIFVSIPVSKWAGVDLADFIVLKHRNQYQDQLHTFLRKTNKKTPNNFGRPIWWPSWKIFLEIRYLGFLYGQLGKFDQKTLEDKPTKFPVCIIIYTIPCKYWCYLVH